MILIMRDNVINIVLSAADKITVHDLYKLHCYGVVEITILIVMLLFTVQCHVNFLN